MEARFLLTAAFLTNYFFIYILDYLAKQYFEICEGLWNQITKNQQKKHYVRNVFFGSPWKQKYFSFRMFSGEDQKRILGKNELNLQNQVTSSNRES